ncbi:MAG: hypothetical protein IT303_13615 [Dehalococcoidia bacterium]|nr:hypothetical protein [Dehalococcoidia bacterium]
MRGIGRISAWLEWLYRIDPPAMAADERLVRREVAYLHARPAVHLQGALTVTDRRLVFQARAFRWWGEQVRIEGPLGSGVMARIDPSADWSMHPAYPAFEVSWPDGQHIRLRSPLAEVLVDAINGTLPGRSE